jgi:hypothetical protein
MEISRIKNEVRLKLGAIKESITRRAPSASAHEAGAHGASASEAVAAPPCRPNSLRLRCAIGRPARGESARIV